MSPRFPLRGRDHLDTPERKRRFNRLHFETAAPRYDFATKALSLGRDASWKRTLVEALPDLAAPVCIDIACGTGDVAFLLAARYPRGTVAGMDLVGRMLERARRRRRRRNVSFGAGDLCALPFAAGCADIVTGAYALRNAPDLRAALEEVRRVLKADGCAAILDFCRPRGAAFRRALYLLLRGWGGLWGILLHGTPEVHGYIAESLERFPDRRRFREILGEKGFSVAASRRLFPGVTELLVLRLKEGTSLDPARGYNEVSKASGRPATERLCERRGGVEMEMALTGSEKQVLRETLEKAINDLLMEIARTDNRKMREGLREREEILKGILERLPMEAHTAA